MGDQLDRLRRRVERSRHWPPPKDKDAWAQVTKWQAFREADRTALRQIANWDQAPKMPAPRGIRQDEREYLVDPLPEKIGEAFADLNYGQPPTIVPGVETDKDNIDDLVKKNRFPSALKRESATTSSEGEVFYRVRADLDVSDRAIIDWYSRAAVIPLFSGRRLVACAFVSRLYDLDGDPEGAAWRLLEFHDDEDVTNVLYLGSDDKLGQAVALDQHPETEDLNENWNHELGEMLAGRIVNREGADPTLGKSDFHGISDFLLALNEVLTIGQENARLTLKRRVVVPAAALDESGRIPAGQEAIVAEAVDQDMGGTNQGAGAFKVLEYTFDADALIKYGDSLAIKALSRIGINAQFIGVPTEDGYATTGTALRLRLVPTKNAADGRGGFFDEETPEILRKAARVDALAQDAGGCGNSWADPESLPSVGRSPAIPTDPMEEAMRHETLVIARLESRKTAIQNLHPDWDDDRVDQEIEDIDRDQPSSPTGTASTIFSALTNGQGADRPPPPVDNNVPPSRDAAVGAG